MCAYVRACVPVDVYRKGYVCETESWIVSSATPSLTIKTSGYNQRGSSINFILSQTVHVPLQVLLLVILIVRVVPFPHMQQQFLTKFALILHPCLILSMLAPY